MTKRSIPFVTSNTSLVQVLLTIFAAVGIFVKWDIMQFFKKKGVDKP